MAELIRRSSVGLGKRRPPGLWQLMRLPRRPPLTALAHGGAAREHTKRGSVDDGIRPWKNPEVGTPHGDLPVAPQATHASTVLPPRSNTM